jgi:hypothetical protein
VLGEQRYRCYASVMVLATTICGDDSTLLSVMHMAGTVLSALMQQMEHR